MLHACQGSRRPPRSLPVTAKPIFERAFRVYGLPRAIRTDNGVPFATQAIHGLSYLNVWWMRLGVAHQRIHPGQPQENGAHERMHRTMKRRAIKPVQRTCASQQKVFDAFRTEYNTERPHEALQQETPATFYTRSSRSYPGTLPTVEYPLHFLVKKVTDAGTFRIMIEDMILVTQRGREPLGVAAEARGGHRPLDDEVARDDDHAFGPLSA